MKLAINFPNEVISICYFFRLLLKNYIFGGVTIIIFNSTDQLSSQSYTFPFLVLEKPHQDRAGHKGSNTAVDG